MPRNMSFALTTDQVRRKTKTVTRRFGWWFLKPGDEINAVEKAMGLKKGEKINQLAKIKVISVRKEPLAMMSLSDCAKEGFPEMIPRDFIAMLRKHYGSKITGDSMVNRIEFDYL